MTDSTFQGLPVLALQPDSPSYKAGVRVGDRILIANGIRIDTMESYVEARQVKEGSLDLTIQRGNQILDVSMVFEGK